jgi:hypothetical protein
MPASLHFVRVLIGLICIFCAHFLGRSAARTYNRKSKDPQLMRWVLRTLVAAAGVMWHGGLDTLTLSLLIPAAVVAAIGWYVEQRPRKEEEDLSDEIFPKE